MREWLRNSEAPVVDLPASEDFRTADEATNRIIGIALATRVIEEIRATPEGIVQGASLRIIYKLLTPSL